MDIPDDPSTTTTNTTDYDSGDSEGVDYVYEGQITTQRTKTTRRSVRKKSPKARTHTCAKCARATSYAEDEAEFTVFEDTDTEDEGRQHRRRPSGCGNCSGYGDRGRRKPERRTAEARTAGRARSPYVEEYPELLPRPLIILKEHRIPGRPSVPDARRLRDSAERSLSSSRGRSPAAKRLPPRPSRLASKESSKHHEHRKHRLDRQACHKDNRSGSEVRAPQSDCGGPSLPTRHRHGEARPEMASTVARSSAWDDAPQPQYSSSWPLQKGAHLAKAKPKHQDHVYSSESESESEDVFNADSHFDDKHRLIRTRVPSFRDHVPEREVERVHETRRREIQPPAREREREHEQQRRVPPPRPRPRMIVSRPSMATMDQGYRSVATSLCDVWQGDAGEWESPYASVSEDDLDSGIDEPIGLLRMDDLPGRRSSPRLLPPRGGRENFGFQAANQPPPALPSMHPSPDISRDHLWPLAAWTGLLLLEAPPAPSTDRDVTSDDDGGPYTPRGPPFLPPRPAPPRHSPNNPHHPPPRSRAVSPVFSARRTREFLSPRPTRAARFDFGAWGCDRGSASSVALGLA